MNLGLRVAITTTLLAVAPPASSNDVDGKAGFEIMVSFYKQINRATSEEQIEEITDAVQDSSSSLTVEQGEFIFDALNERRVLLDPFNDEIIAKEFTQLCDDVKELWSYRVSLDDALARCFRAKDRFEVQLNSWMSENPDFSIDKRRLFAMRLANTIALAEIERFQGAAK